MSVYEIGPEDPDRRTRRFSFGTNVVDLDPRHVMQQDGIPRLWSRFGDDRRCTDITCQRTSPTTWIVTAKYEEFDWSTYKGWTVKPYAPLLDPAYAGGISPAFAKWLIAIIVGAIFIAAIASHALGAEVTKYRVIDADTIEAELRLEFGHPTRPEKYRLHDFDAWESRRIRKTLNLTPKEWDAEVIKGKAAKADLEKLLKDAKVIELREVKALKKDPRGRELGDLYIDGVNAADILRQRGHERPKVEK